LHACRSTLEDPLTEVFASEPDFASVRIVGTISLGNQTYNDVPVLLKIYSKKDTLRKFRANAKILAIASIRPPRRTNLPTDIAEIPLALSHEVLLFARTSNDLIIRFWESPVTAENIFARLREKLESNLNKMFSAEYFPYFDEMLLGNKQLLEGEQRDKFAITGISHLLSISGFHFGIVFAIVFALFSIFPNKWVRFVLLSLFMFFYLCIIDFPPSGIRAFIMIVAFLYANTLERKVSPYNVLAFII
jgi:Predicted membrane metal-binding protein